MTRFPENSQRLYLQIANKLITNIREEHLSVGDRLPSERELAATFDVSRQTVREAIIAMEVAGVVEVKLGSGVYVKGFRDIQSYITLEDDPGPIEILEARKVFEGEAAALAARRISSEDLSKLEQLIGAMQRHEESLETLAAETDDQAFHLVIAKATQNSAIVGVISWLWSLRKESKISQAYHEIVRNQGSRPNIIAHKRIFRALANGDPKSASAAMVQHLDQVIEEFHGFSIDQE